MYFTLETDKFVTMGAFLKERKKAFHAEPLSYWRTEAGAGGRVVVVVVTWISGRGFRWQPSIPRPLHHCGVSMMGGEQASPARCTTTSTSIFSL